MPKCVVVDPNFDWKGQPRSRGVPWDQTIIYEAHLRGFTRLHALVPPKQRGTYVGLGSRAVIDYVKSLGVTSIELLPIHTFINDSQLLERGLSNYWGYNSIGFFAPDPRYAFEPEQCLKEFKEMVARFHDAGLEVILDVVYNHTAEGNERGPTLSFKGIDNASYYRLLPDNKRFYVNDTGTGNTLNLSHPGVIQMVTDSLRYWVNELHVDGFRFDLGTILAREPEWLRQSERVPEGLPSGSGAALGEADRRALGRRSGRLSGRRLSARLGGMERPLSRCGARLLERLRRRQ
jgi:isoamylase